jgi:hypothetical protein
MKGMEVTIHAFLTLTLSSYELLALGPVVLLQGRNYLYPLDRGLIWSEFILNIAAKRKLLFF